MLILAGVSIAMLTGNNGILTQAQNSQRETEIGEEKEQIALAYNGAIAEKQSTDVTADDLNRNFGYNNTNANATDGEDGTILVNFPDTNRTYTIDANGTILGPDTGSVEPPGETLIAGDVLIPNEEGATEEEKSPFVQYNGILCRVLYNDETHGLQIISADNIEGGDVTLGENDPTVTAEDFTYDGSAIVDDNFKKAAASYNKAVDTLYSFTDDPYSTSYTYGFRPVFLLPSDVVISSGDGSEGNPYIIE